jgi:hypothetical protein
MELDAKEAIRGEMDALQLECAIVDGINIYMREVLIPRGICDPNKDQDHAGSEQNEAKYEIALRVALSYLRPK